MGSIMGSFDPTFYYSGKIGEYYRKDFGNDFLNIYNDFLSVGRDIRTAMNKFENSNEFKHGKQLELFGG